MAEINCSLAEIIDILSAVNLLPEDVSDIHVDDNIVSFKYNTKLVFPSHVVISVQFLEHKNGVTELELSTSWLVEKIIGKLPFLKNNDLFQLSGSRLFINLEKFLNQRFKGIKLESIEFTDHKFKIVFFTYH